MYESREIFPVGQTVPRSLDSSVTSAVIFDVREWDSLVLQLVQSAAWPGGMVLTLEGCTREQPDTWSALSTAVTYTTEGIKSVSTAGLAFVKLYVSTTGGSITINVYARGVREVMR